MKNECFICGSRRQRNLLVSYQSTSFTRSLLVLLYSHDKLERLYKEGKVDKRVICKRCQFLEDVEYLRSEDIPFIGDRYYPADRGMYRYKDRIQLFRTKEHFGDLPP